MLRGTSVKENRSMTDLSVKALQTAVVDLVRLEDTVESQ